MKEKQRNRMGFSQKDGVALLQGEMVVWEG